LTIKKDIRAKIIEMAETGKGRNKIVEQLKLDNIKCSSGSVSSILKKWK